MTNQIWTYINIILQSLSYLLVRFFNENILSLKDLCLPMALKQHKKYYFKQYPIKRQVCDKKK